MTLIIFSYKETSLLIAANEGKGPLIFEFCVNVLKTNNTNLNKIKANATLLNRSRRQPSTYNAVRRTSEESEVGNEPDKSALLDIVLQQIQQKQ